MRSPLRHASHVDEVRRYPEEFAASVDADEVIVAHHGVDTPARLRSVELTAAEVGLTAPVTFQDIAGSGVTPLRAGSILS